MVITSGLFMLCLVVYFCIDETRVKDKEGENEDSIAKPEEMTLEEKMGSWTVLKNVIRKHFKPWIRR